MKLKDVESRDIRIINNIYYKHEAEIRIQNHLKGKIQIRCGREGSLLSPSLLSLNSEDIFKKPSQDETVGLKSYGLPVCDIRYADKTATALQNLYDVKRILEEIHDNYKETYCEY